MPWARIRIGRDTADIRTVLSRGSRLWVEDDRSRQLISVGPASVSNAAINLPSLLPRWRTQVVTMSRGQPDLLAALPTERESSDTSVTLLFRKDAGTGDVLVVDSLLTIGSFVTAHSPSGSARTTLDVPWGYRDFLIPNADATTYSILRQRPCSEGHSRCMWIDGDTTARLHPLLMQKAPAGVARSDVQRFVSDRLPRTVVDALGGVSAVTQDLWARIRRGTKAPMYDRLIVDAAGNIFVELASTDAVRHWLRFGRASGQVEPFDLPSHLIVADIRDRMVLAISPGGQGIDSLYVLRLAGG